MSSTAWLEARARRTPRGAALAEAGRVLSWEALARRARDAARGLRALGAGPGRPVALRLAGAPFAVALHAAWRLGTPVLPLHARLPEAEARRQVALVDAGPEVDPESFVELEARGAAADAPALPPLPVDPDAPALLLFTSGTTAAPRAAVLAFRELRASAEAAARHLAAWGARPDAPDDTALACLPLFHVGGLSLLVRSVLSGGAVRVHGRFDAEAVRAGLRHEGITRVSLVPTTLRRLLDADEAADDTAAPPALRTLLLGGAAAPPALLRRARERGWPVLPTYGLTEAASQVATAAPGDDAPDLAARLWPLPGTRVLVTDEDGTPLPAGAEGEIRVQGPTVFRGYRGDPEATARVLVEGAPGALRTLRTGDVGRLDAAGRLAVVDRRDDLVVSGGENVAPAEVEAALAEHPDVAEVAVFGLPDADLGRRVVAWVVPAAERAPQAEALRRHARLRLAGPKVPREVRFVAALPRTALGKVRRRALPGLDATEGGGGPADS